MARQLILTLAVVVTGLGAGVYVTYALAVMPGLARTDDRTFVTAFAAIDRAIVSPVFLGGVFLGAPVLLLLAALTGATERPALVWTALALVLAATILTVAVNVPLNDALKAAEGLPDLDPGPVRAAFREGRWAVANATRTALEVGALVLLLLAGRA